MAIWACRWDLSCRRMAWQFDLTDGRGVVIVHMRPDSPAAKAGLQEHDIIVQVNDQIIYSVMQMAKLISAQQPGTTVNIKIIHKAQPKTIQVQLGGSAYQSWRRMVGMRMHRRMGHMGWREGGMMGQGMGGEMMCPCTRGRDDGQG